MRWITWPRPHSVVYKSRRLAPPLLKSSAGSASYAARAGCQSVSQKRCLTDEINVEIRSASSARVQIWFIFFNREKSGLWLKSWLEFIYREGDCVMSRWEELLTGDELETWCARAERVWQESAQLTANNSLSVSVFMRKLHGSHSQLSGE